VEQSLPLLVDRSAVGHQGKGFLRKADVSSLRTRLTILVAAAILPLLLFSLVHEYRRFQQSREDAALELAKATARAVAQRIEARFVALRVLALAPELQSGDFKEFRRKAEALIAQEAPGSNILVLREDGQHMMNTAAPPDAVLPRRVDLTSLQKLFRTGEPSISDVFVGVVVRRPVVAIEVPVRGPDGRVIFGMTLNPTPNAFIESRQVSSIPAATITVYDRNGVIVSRSREHERYVGTKSRDHFLSYLRSEPEGVIQTESADGAASLVAFTHVAPFGWAVSVDIPSALLTAGALGSVTPTLLVGALMLLCGMIAAAVVAKSITRPIAELQQIANAPEQAVWPVNSTIAELQDVARALQDSFTRSQNHQRQLEKTIDQRDLLLREVYHRVKNNLQVVDALIRMEFRRVEDKDLLESLRQLLNRIHTLSLVHAQLMSSEDLSHFDIAPLFAELASNLQAALSTGEHDIKIKVEAESLDVPLDFALPVGLLLVELIMNSAKHAYGARSGEISVQFACDPEGRAMLSVQDNGSDPDAPARFMAARGIGSKLVAGFVRQLDGEIAADFTSGMRVVVRMPIPERTDDRKEMRAGG
jgi:two-component sensor histidine kinase